MHTALKGSLAAVGICFLILDSQTALSSAREGLSLCLHSIIPGLFPFFLLTGIISSGLMGKSILILRPLGILCGLPKGSESFLIPAFLGGYPMGARTAAELYSDHKIDRDTANWLLSFGSNCGPAFFFGFLSPLFEDRQTVWLLWGIHIAAAVAAARLFLPDTVHMVFPEKKGVSPAQLMNQALKAIGAVCGWILCFRVITGFLKKWILWRLPVWGQAAVTGVLELTNGCSMLETVSAPELKFLLASGLLSFGGLCVLMQTASFLGNLSLRPYFLGKLVQSALSIVMAFLIIRKLYAGLLLAGILFVSLGIRKKGGNLRPVSV